MNLQCISCVFYQEKGALCQQTNMPVEGIDECDGYRQDPEWEKKGDSQKRIESYVQFVANQIREGVAKEAIIEALMREQLSREEAEECYRKATDRRKWWLIGFLLFLVSLAIRLSF